MGAFTRLLDLSQKAAFRSFDSAIPKHFDWFRYGLPTASGKSVSPKSSLMLAHVYHAVEQISDDYASLPYKVFKPKDGAKEDQKGHNVDRLLNFRPNYYQTPIEYRRMMSAFRLLFGNAYAYIDRDPESAEIRNLLPIHPDKVAQISLQDDILYYPVKGFERPIPSYNMIHVKDISIEEDDWKGMSRIDYCREMIGRGLGLDEFLSSFYGNSATPGLIFESDLGVFESDDQRKEFRDSLVKYKGSARAHDNLILPSGVKLSQGPKGFSQQQTQFIETKIHHVEEVAALFNLPLHKMRIKTDGNSYNSQEQANQDYITDRLRPYCKGFEQEYNLKVFKARELGKMYTEVNMNSRLRGDIKTQTDHAYKMLMAGAYNKDEVREAFGRNPIPEGKGKEFYQQTNLIELGETPQDNGQANAGNEG